MQPQSEAASEQDPRVSLSVADMVAAAADAADGSPALSQGWPADASSVWPRSDLWPSQLPWPSEAGDLRRTEEAIPVNAVRC
eukprot:g21717.t1